jgi:hypothetical protein
MTMLQDALTAVENADAIFEASLKGSTRWMWYRGELGEQPTITAAHENYVKTLHIFYSLRDGPNGFLGGRGL